MKKPPRLLLILTMALTLPTLVLPARAMERRCTTQHSKNTSERVEFFVVCTNEFVTLFNKNNVTTRFCDNGDGTSTLRIRVATSLTAIGETSGNEYVGSQHVIDRGITGDPATLCPSSFTEDIQAVIVSKGALPNLQATIRLTITNDEDCNIAVVVEVFDMTCRGRS